MKKQKYLNYLNDNYFYEIGFEKKQSKLKNLKIKKHRQFRSRQGRSDKRYIESYKAFTVSLFCLILIFVIIFLSK